MNNRTFYNEVLTDHNRYPGDVYKRQTLDTRYTGDTYACSTFETVPCVDHVPVSYTHLDVYKRQQA